MSAEILVVDDDPMIRMLINEFLKASGYTVELATGGGECLEKLATGYRPTLIILDLQMPELDGNETLARLRNDTNTKSIPVIMLSANVDNCSNSEDLKADGYIEKPFQMGQFLAVVREVLG